jgi:hypothetical protein
MYCLECSQPDPEVTCIACGEALHLRDGWHCAQEHLARKCAPRDEDLEDEET